MPKDPAQDRRDADRAELEALLASTQERLRECEERYRHTIELSGQMAWTASPDRRITAVSPAFNALTGLPPDLDPHQAWLAAVHPDDVERLMDLWAQPPTSEPHEADFRMKDASGAYRLFRVRAAAKLGDAGEVVGWYGYTEDITERRAAEQALRQAEERYRLAAMATDDAVWDHEFASGEVYWIDSASAFLGLPGGEGRTPASYWPENIHPDDRERVIATTYGAIEAGLDRWSSEYRFRSRGGNYVLVLDRGFAIRDGDGRCVRAVGSMADITERRRAELELKQMQAELVQVSRQSAMGAMASTLAHELNQPLTAVASYVRGALRLLEASPTPLSPDARSALRAAEGAALRAGQIVRSLRELVSRKGVKTQAQDLARVVEEAAVLGFVDEQARGVTRSICIDPEARWVEADSIQIQQVLINLIRNAIEATAGCPRREISIAARPGPDDMVELSVADTGQGLSEEARGRLFSPFGSSKPEGMGIGLSISRTIVEAHGGRIWADDAPGGGAVFRFTLPAAREPAAKERRARAAKA